MIRLLLFWFYGNNYSNYPGIFITHQTQNKKGAVVRSNPQLPVVKFVCLLEYMLNIKSAEKTCTLSLNSPLHCSRFIESYIGAIATLQNF